LVRLLSLKCKGVWKKKKHAGHTHPCADPAGWTPLHWAAAINDVESVIALIDARKPTLNVQNKKGETPLHLAARENNVDVIRYADVEFWARGAQNVGSALPCTALIQKEGPLV
jgi:ankyrin repeat protein